MPNHVHGIIVIQSVGASIKGDLSIENSFPPPFLTKGLTGISLIESRSSLLIRLDPSRAETDCYP
jgi:hypothetical protein